MTDKKETPCRDVAFAVGGVALGVLIGSKAEKTWAWLMKALSKIIGKGRGIN